MKKKKELLVITLPKDIKDLKVVGTTDELSDKQINKLVKFATLYHEAFARLALNVDMNINNCVKFIKAMKSKDVETMEVLRKEYPDYYK